MEMHGVTPGGSHTGKGKIFYLIRSAAGGMRNHLLQLIGSFSRDYAIYLGAPPDPDLPRKAGIAQGAFFSMPLNGGINPAGDLITFYRLRRLLHRIRPELLHIHGFKAALPGIAAARAARIPVLITAHNYPAHRASSYMPAAGKLLGAQKVRFIAVSGDLAGKLAALGIPRGMISVIHNGIEPAPYEAAAAGRRLQYRRTGGIIVGTAARFARQKGLFYFVQAAAVLAPLFPRMRFLVMGDGPGRPDLEKLVLQSGLSGRLSFCGHCTDLPHRLAAIDIFVLPSLTEGLPLTLLEAAVAGCALAATRVGGIPEVITDGVHGLLVPPADEVALARAIASLARDPVLAHRLAQACSERVKTQFTLDRTISRTAFLYRRLTESGAGRRGPFSWEAAGKQ